MGGLEGILENDDAVSCRICQRPASGIHYGVTSCEGCKAFFKRSLKASGRYRCFRSGRCEIAAQTPPCRACRYNKCLEEGMSIEGIRMGRSGANASPPASVDHFSDRPLANFPTLSFCNDSTSAATSSPAELTNLSTNLSDDLFFHYGKLDSPIHDPVYDAVTTLLPHNHVVAADMVYQRTIHSVEAAINAAYTDQIVRWDEFMERITQHGSPTQPEISAEMMIASFAYSVNDSVQRAKAFTTLLAGFQHFDDAYKGKLIFEKWVEVILIHLARYVKGDEFFFSVPPFEVHFCRYWADRLVNPDYVDFGLRFTNELSRLALTTIETYVLMVIAILWQENVDFSSKISTYQQLLHSHYVETLFYLVNHRLQSTAQAVELIEKLKDLMVRFRDSQYMKNKYLAMEDMRVPQPDLGGSALFTALLSHMDVNLVP